MSLDAQLLAAFRQADDGHVTAAALSQQLGVSHSTINRHLDELREVGFDIQHQPSFGYRIVHWPDILLAADIKHRLGKPVIGREVLVYEKTASTNDLVEKLAMDGAAEGLVAFAESQSRGRGRMGRTWVSPRGKGLWFSVLLRPRLTMSQAGRLTIAASVAIARAIRQLTDLPVEIKWPNDILIGGRKCGGILAEMRTELDLIKHVVLGIGLDVNCELADFPPEIRAIATSLRQETARHNGSIAAAPLSRGELAVVALKELDRLYGMACHDDTFETVRREWGQFCCTLGKRVSLQIGSHRLEGFAQALDEDGALLLRCDNGRIERVIGGDVAMEK